MITWRRWRWHMSMYHGYKRSWMFGLPEAELIQIHGVCFDWCHKPDRDGAVIGYITVEEIREALGLKNESRR